MSFKCKCGSKMKVVDCRPMSDTDLGHAFRRRRHCGNCGRYVTTYEISFDIIRPLREAAKVVRLMRDVMRALDEGRIMKSYGQNGNHSFWIDEKDNG